MELPMVSLPFESKQIADFLQVNCTLSQGSSNLSGTSTHHSQGDLQKALKVSRSNAEHLVYNSKVSHHSLRTYSNKFHANQGYAHCLIISHTALQCCSGLCGVQNLTISGHQAPGSATQMMLRTTGVHLHPCLMCNVQQHQQRCQHQSGSAGQDLSAARNGRTSV